MLRDSSNSIRVKLFLSLMFILASAYSIAQWHEFNWAHPVSCQWEPYDYQAGGFFENVVVVDTNHFFYDGYLFFGRGILCHPDSCVNNERCFSAKCNENGEVNWWNRYDEEDVDENMIWLNENKGNQGGMVLNREKRVVSILSTSVISDEFDEETRDYLVTMDLHGVIIEQHLVDSTWAEYSFWGLIEDITDSTYVAYGQYRDSLSVVSDEAPESFILKMDGSGNQIWQRSYPGLSGVWSLVKAMDGGYWVVNEKEVSNCSDGITPNTDMVLLKTDEYGHEEDWLQLGGSCGLEQATVFETKLDKVVLAGRLTDDSEPDPSIPYSGYFYTSLVKQLPNGQLTEPYAVKEYLHDTPDGTFTDFHRLEDGSYMMAGHHKTVASNIQAGFLLKLDSNRDSLWCKTYTLYEEEFDGNPQDDAMYFLNDSKPTPDSGFVCCGWIHQMAENPNPGLLTPWVFKVDSVGCLEPGCHTVGVSEIIVGLESTMRVYPNPVSDIANIEFNLPPGIHEMSTELVLINIQGQKVLRHSLSPTAHFSLVQIDVSTLNSGIYIAHWVDESRWFDSVKLVVER